MKRIFPQNYAIMILTIGAMYGFIGYFSVIESNQYFVLPILITLTVFTINRRIYLAYDHLIIIQGFTIIKVKYNDIKTLSVKNTKPKLSRITVPVIIITINSRDKKIFYFRMYSANSLGKIIDTLIDMNRNIKLSANILSLLKR